MNESWWAEHGYQVVSGLWIFTSGTIALLWWFVRRDRATIDKDLKALKDTAEQVEARAIEKAKSAESTALSRMEIMKSELTHRITTVESGLERVTQNYRSQFEGVRADIRCTREQVLEKIADLKVTRAELYVTKEELHAVMKEIRDNIQSLVKR